MMAGGFKSTGVTLFELCAHSGAQEGFVQRGDQLIESTLSVSDANTERLVKKVNTIVAAYRQSGRTSPEICLNFQGGTLFIVWGNTAGVTMKFDGKIKRMEGIIAECRSFLKQSANDTPISHSTQLPVDPTRSTSTNWSEFKPSLTRILSSVLSKAQATRMIDRVLAKNSISEPVPDSQLEDVANLVLANVPDRNKRAALSAETRDEIILLLQP